MDVSVTLSKLWVSLLLLLSATAFSLELSPLRQPPYTGDLDVIKEKNVLRVLVSADLGFYYIEGGEPKGIGAELLAHFEKELRKIKPKLNVQIIPVSRDELLPSLEQGLGDLVVANLTITNTRKDKVDFSDPIMTGIEEWIVTNKATPVMTNIDQLSGKEIWLRASSSYFESIQALNKKLNKKGLAPVVVHFIEETLQDYELVGMLNNGYVKAIVLDSHKAKLWMNVMNDIRAQTKIPIRTGGKIAWAMRHDSPELMKIVNKFIRTSKSGTLLGNVIYGKYISNTNWLNKALNPKKIAQLEKLSSLFSRYADKYDFDYLMVAAVAYQESGFDNSLVSSRGAVGVMQILPSTASDPNVNIKNVRNLENNVHAGVKYMAFLRRYYFSDDAITKQNKMYFTLAAYNAGPGNVERMRKRAAQRGYDPNIWFHNVEVVMRSGLGETVRYVTNVNRYYVIYKQLESLDLAKSLDNVLLVPDDPVFMTPLRRISQTPNTKTPLSN
ncbi:transglycosylase SLT domain-containing protein [Vibrio alfacsensis]|uniref:transglycosylase SLT domain-containing protein n=1 Tax=Vibrio alfacsensis TaxID=1074311 RepID=UPI001C8044D2|nr:lytic transglycosylase F [Vibrio alfacsensis]